MVPLYVVLLMVNSIFCLIIYYLNYVICSVGVLLDDLLVAEDLAAAETTNAASHAAAATAMSSVQAGRTGRYGFGDEGTRQNIPESVPEGAVMLGTPVAPPANGDMHTDISTENAMLQGPR